MKKLNILSWLKFRPNKVEQSKFMADIRLSCILLNSNVAKNDHSKHSQVCNLT